MKIKGPLMSQQAQKTLGGVLEFSRRHGKNLLRFHQQPTGAASSGQNSQRNYHADACAAWTTLTPEEKLQWHNFNRT